MMFILQYLMEGKCHTLPPIPMDSEPSSLGTCPDCDDPIAPARKLIEYKDGNGNTRCFAECPTCDEVVKPV